MHGEHEKCAQNFGHNNLNKQFYSEDIDIDGIIILKYVFEKYD
jgi:hypothetical protein